MNTNDSSSNGFNASLPLPEDDTPKTGLPDRDAHAAADLIRKRVEAAYAAEPDATEEIADTLSAGQKPRSRHQQFIYELTSSGQSLENIQTAWHEYYASLSDVQKHEVWQEFYSAHAAASHAPTGFPSMAPKSEQTKPKAILEKLKAADPAALDDIRTQAVASLKTYRGGKLKDSLKSLLFGLGVGTIVIVVFLFSFFNERFIAPFIQPSRAIAGAPIIGANAPVTNASEIIIPKINLEVPVIYDVNTINDDAVENALESGVVHYADTALPGQNGNLVIVGHSSNNIFNGGRYKFAFVLLHDLDNGDIFYLQKDGKRYTYQVYKKSIVSPTDVSVLGPEDKPATATLITCDPPGTSNNRLVVVGEQIDPSIGSNVAASGSNSLATSTNVVPGNSPTLWSRLTSGL